MIKNEKKYRFFSLVCFLPPVKKDVKIIILVLKQYVFFKIFIIIFFIFVITSHKYIGLMSVEEGKT